MHRIAEIALTLADGRTLRARPKAEGVSLIPVDLPGVNALELSRAIRATVAHPARLAGASAVPAIEVRLESPAEALTVRDDRGTQSRRVAIEPGGAASVDTSRVADPRAVAALLKHVGAALEFGALEALGPALACVRREARPAEASPKELALLRTFERRLAAARALEVADRQIEAPRLRADRALAAIGVAAVVVLLAGVALPEEIRSWALPLTWATVTAGLGGLLLAAHRRAGTPATREEDQLRAFEALGKASADASELEDTMVRRGADPDEILGRIASLSIPPGLPAIVGQTAFTAADLHALTELSRPVIVFVDRQGLLFPDDFAAVLTPLA